jgi:hypothetical protein
MEAFFLAARITKSTMTTDATTTPEALAAVIGRAMNGDGIPASDSPEFRDLTSLVDDHLQHGTAHDREQLGVRVLGLLIDACRARIAADEVLRDIGDRA